MLLNRLLCKLSYPGFLAAICTWLEHSAAVADCAWLLRLAEAVELPGLLQPALLALTFEAFLALSWVEVGFGRAGTPSRLTGMSELRLANQSVTCLCKANQQTQTA